MLHVHEHKETISFESLYNKIRANLGRIAMDFPCGRDLGNAWPMRSTSHKKQDQHCKLLFRLVRLLTPQARQRIDLRGL